jgi:hypothetical protein
LATTELAQLVSNVNNLEDDVKMQAGRLRRKQKELTDARTVLAKHEDAPGDDGARVAVILPMEEPYRGKWVFLVHPRGGIERFKVPREHNG